MNRSTEEARPEIVFRAVTRGFVVPIGGAEEKLRDPAILRRFVELCGGARARIAVIPTASKLRKTGRVYEEIFRELGAASALSLPFEGRADCARADWLAALAEADGVFLTGGNQLRLSTTLGGTPVADLLRRRNATEGLHVAGTSAGAAFLSEHMIAFGDEGPTPRSDMVTLAPGLGLTTLAVVDQHFRQRDRIGRLITALAYNPRPIGIGLDEDTAAFIDPDDVLEVAGSGAITIVDPSEVSFTSMDSAERHAPVCVLDLRLHVLVDGATYDIRARRAAPPRALLRPVARRGSAGR
jgi:cyanophycinase